MRKRYIAATVSAVALAVPAMALAGPAQYKATGGGQIATAPVSGPADTLSFTGQGSGPAGTDGTKGQLEYNTAAGPRHGIVTCIVTGLDENGIAVGSLGGYWVDNPAEHWKLQVYDYGQGPTDDIIQFGPTQSVPGHPGVGDPSCSIHPTPQEQYVQFRGNSQVFLP